MPQPKGKTGNLNGRPKGSPNKVSQQLRETVQNFLAANSENLQANFELLEPKDKLLFFEKMLRYAVPTLQATSLTTDFDQMTDQQLDTIINELKNKIQDEQE